MPGIEWAVLCELAYLDRCDRLCVACCTMECTWTRPA
jgi:hypothetical protein